METAFFVQALVGLFAVVDPFSASTIFIVMTADNTAGERRAMARRASLVTLLVLVTFLLLGQTILHFFSVSLAAFQVAGGLLLGLMSMDSLKAFRTGVRSTRYEKQEGVEKADVSVTPLAVPLLAGPGAISLVVLYAAEHPGLQAKAMLALVVVVVSLLTWLILRSADRMVDLVGRTGFNVLSRLIGLVVLAIAVQYVFEGASQMWGGGGSGTLVPLSSVM
ncbi:MAG TPA: NAAT family transporter [Mariprofundaceae bacterium]|nr:NAAT family transporter [Mariprofundaceae bacterium]